MCVCVCVCTYICITCVWGKIILAQFEQNNNGVLHNLFLNFRDRSHLCSETWVTTTRDMTRLEAAEMRFVRSVKGYTRLDKIRNEVIRKKLENSGKHVQDVRSKHKQNWINHLEIMDNTRLPKHALNYKPRGRRDRGRPRKRWQRVDAGTGQTT